MMLFTHEPGIMSTSKIRNKKGGSFHFDAVPLIVLSFTTIVHILHMVCISSSNMSYGLCLLFRQLQTLYAVAAAAVSGDETTGG